jgi:sarcosine oxidase subunit alpha
MKDTEILVIGGGPAGLCAAKAASSLGASVVICERDAVPGGQLVKQTHKFFGSRKQYAGDRGIAIGAFLLDEVQKDPKIEVMPDTIVIGIYEDGLVLAERNEEIIKINPKKIIVATGAAEKFLPFPGNDLPGIYGAGAMQTLMNVEGIVPGERVLMIGAGNIGLIVSYQLAQAGVKTAAVIEAAPVIGGYLVHASKIRRIGIPIRTGFTIKEAYGNGKVEGAVVCKLDAGWNMIPGTEEDVKCDTICLAVGLIPLTSLCWQAGCKLAYIKELSGHVPVIDKYMQTTNPKIYAAGDVSGIEEASSAMVEGRLAGYSAAISLGYGAAEGKDAVLRESAIAELNELRAGPLGEKIRNGVEKVEKMAKAGEKC